MGYYLTNEAQRGEIPIAKIVRQAIKCPKPEQYPQVKVRTRNAEVIYTAAGGYEFQKQQADKVLKRGERYEVEKVFVDDWGVYFYLKEIPNRSFNQDMFTVV